MITIYHNPRCRKSREGLQILEESAVDFETRLYLNDPLNESELKELLKKLGIKPKDLIRTNESVWKEHYKGKELSDVELIKAMAEHPKLIERPIVVKDNKAVIGRPASNIKELL